jgi:hypothetical protein
MSLETNNLKLGVPTVEIGDANICADVWVVKLSANEPEVVIVEGATDNKAAGTDIPTDVTVPVP